MARMAGITDLAGRVTRSRNPMNTVKATYKALMSQKMPGEYFILETCDAEPLANLEIR